MSPALRERARAACAAVLGDAAVLADAGSVAEFSRDLVEWPAVPEVLLVARPRTAQEAAALVRVAAGLGVALAPRGGGLSYTGGYVPAHGSVIAVDMTALNAIEVISEADLYVTAGAGTTWQQLHDALAPKGLRTVTAGPISGSHSTVGGAASQNLIGGMDGFIGLEVVLADGSVLRTGSSAALRSPSPFYRNFGPDLTGLFLGDTGAYGIKTKVTLRLERVPEGRAFGSFRYATLAELTAAMAEVARSGLVRRTLALDSTKNRAAAAAGKEDAAGIARDVAKAAAGLAGAASDLAALARGGRALAQSEWSLHVAAEGVDQAAADASLEAVRRICSRSGREIPAAVPIGLHARPFSIRGFLGPDGERWVPIHGIFPLSRAGEVVERIDAFLSARRESLAREGVRYAYMGGTEGPLFVFEPMLYWSDAIGPLHRRYLDPKRVQRFGRAAADPAARAAALKMRDELRGLFLELGALHGQVGKYYDFRAGAAPEAYELLTKLKRMLDPQGRMNPGNFGWRGES